MLKYTYLGWDFIDHMGRSNSFLEVLHTFNRQMQNPTYKKNLPTSCQDMNFCLISANAKSMQQVVLHRVTLLHPNRMDPKIPIQVPSFFSKPPYNFKMFYCIVVAATASQKRGLKVWPETQNGFPWMIAVISGQTSFSMVVHNNGQSNYHFFRSIWDALCYR